MGAKDLLLAAAIVAAAFVIRLAFRLERRLRFRPRPVLTGAEWSFYFRLRDALPECVVCPQVAVSALIEPAGVGPARRLAAESIEADRVGYAVFDHDLQLLAVIELGHRARPTRREMARDRWFAEAGVRTVRFHARRPPSTGRIKRSIFAQGLAADCPGAGPKPRFAVRRLEPVWRNTANFNV
ncbi:DUF2726 domain-containing protein [Oxalobacteraceae bacterium OM1]|nr:DUF2726 domain-containing protein [Oxalobacteraceae bacterium OM1]